MSLGMFVYLLCIILLASLLQCQTEQIQIWVKPDSLKYKAEIICRNRHNQMPTTIGTASKNFWQDPINVSVIIDANFGLCDPNQPNATIKITELSTNKMVEFDFPRLQLRESRQAPVVLGFNSSPPLAHKKFIIQQEFSNNDRPNYVVHIELELMCYIQLESYYIGSAFHYYGSYENGIDIPLYQTTEILKKCDYGEILVVLHQHVGNRNGIERLLRMQLEQFNAFAAFKLGGYYSIAPIRDSRISNPQQSTPSINTPENTGSSNSSNVATPPSVSTNPPSSVANTYAGPCVVCLEAKRTIAFDPCGHVCMCEGCARQMTKCPMCRRNIIKKLHIFLS